jgi:hypothetical protein
MQPADDLERLVHRELRALPPPRAPETLLPRVLAAVDAWSHRPWYARAWFTWPLGWQIASAAAVALVFYALWSLPSAPPEVAAATSASRVVWRTLVQPLLTYVFVLVALMCVACAVFGAALNYLFMERTASR